MSDDKAEVKVERKRRRLYEAPEQNEEKAVVVQSDGVLFQQQLERDFRRAEANDITVDYALITAATALVPIPLVDAIAAGLSQIQIVRVLAKLYGVDYAAERARALIAGLISGIQTGLIARSLIKIIPFYGSLAMSIPSAVISGAVTYAIGQVFIEHFESGGTLLDFRVEKMRDYFEAQFKRGQEIVMEKRAAN